VDNQERKDCSENGLEKEQEKAKQKKREIKHKENLKKILNINTQEEQSIIEIERDGSKEKLKILYSNVDGLANKLDDLENRIDKFNPDIIILCESKLDEKIGNEGISKHYQVIRKDREGEGRGGGICMLLKNEFILLERKDLNLKQTGKVEHMWYDIKTRIDTKMITIGVVYRPPNTEREDDKKLFELLFEAEDKTKGNQLLVLGDFNMPNIRWNKNDSIGERADKELKNFNSLFWKQNVDQETRIRLNNEPSLLDLIFTRTKNEISSIEYHEPMGKSDHVVIIFEIMVESLMRIKEEIPKRNYFKLNKEEAHRLFSLINWEDEFHNKNTNECYLRMLEVHDDVVQECVPFRSARKLEKKQKWMTKEVIKAINRRDHAWKDYRNSPSEDNHIKYNKLRNTATWIKRDAKEKLEMNLALQIKENKNTFFSYVKSRSKIKPEIGAIRLKNGELSKDNLEAAKALNEAFQSVFVRETQKENVTVEDEVASNNYKDTEEEITVKEIRDVLKKLIAGKAFGPDMISTEMIKLCEDDLIKPISIIFNKSWKEGSIPEIWRCANVLPIFKKGTKEDPLNFRPVSLTCVLCKLMETIIKNRLMIDLDKEEILIEEQHGFRSNHSTTTNLLEFYNEVTKELDNKHAVDIFFFDLSKAFDMVPHTRLINKLKTLKISDKVVRWIENYLSGRRQRVMVRGEMSDWLEIFSGVPQGSVIGPILFLIYINDIKRELKSRVSIFADDTKILHIVDTEEDRVEVEQDLIAMQNWADQNKMKFNIDKCSVMHCGYSNKRNNYTMYGKELRKTDCEKDLGVLIDSDMKFASQIAAQTKKAYKVLGMIKRNFECTNGAIFQILYSTLVRPHLEYAVQVWNPYQIGHRKKLEQVQRRATKMVKEVRKLKYDQRLVKLNLMSTETRRTRGDMIMTFKILKDMVKIKKGTIMVSSEKRTRGNSLKLSKSTLNSDQRKYFFSNRIIKDWNDLGDDIITSKNIEEFKSTYDRYKMLRPGGRITS
jgi:hypothetical protein